MRLRELAVRPNQDQLHLEAKDLLGQIQAEDPEAVSDFRELYPAPLSPVEAKLADAQFVLARNYRAANWTRLIQAAQLAEAIWQDDSDEVMNLISTNPDLLHEHVLIRSNSNWGPPMSYAANLGRDHIIQLLFDRGATDLEKAIGRAALQGKITTVYLIHELAGRPSIRSEKLAGSAYTLNVEGTSKPAGDGLWYVQFGKRNFAPFCQSYRRCHVDYHRRISHVFHGCCVGHASRDWIGL